LPNAQVNVSGSYVVIVTDANTCTNTAVANVEVDPQPAANIQTNSPICINNVLLLSGMGGVSYAWTGPNGFFSSVQSPTIDANTVAYTGNYNLTVTDAKGCTASVSQQATVNPIPSITLTSDKTNGCPPLCVSYSCQAAPAITAYNWNLGNGVTGSNPVEGTCYSTPGTYTVMTSVTDVNGCGNAATFTVQVHPVPTADFNYDPIKPVENVDEVHFTDATYNATITSWSWYFNSTAQYASSIQNPTFTYAEAGEYAVALVVKSNKGCSDTVVKNVLVGEDFGIYLPNAFTPNGDGLNDNFHAKGFGVTKFEMQIFDRWGEKVFESTDLKDAWDGTHSTKGTKVISEGVYSWRVKVTSVYGKATELTGHVTLIK
ncbi:MAG: T9SS type B sorting domain-containing protein, partial [Bacteroidia bacterium]